MTEEEQKHQEFLARCAKFTGDIEKLIETHEKTQKILSELEYASYIKLIWSRFGIWNDKYAITPSFERTTNRRGYLVLKRSDGSTQAFPVRVKEAHYSYVQLAFNIVDMWDEGLLPERFFELFLMWCNKKSPPAQASIRRERKLRLDREAKRTPPKRDYFELARGIRFNHSGSLVEPDSITPPESGVWTDGVSGDGRPKEVEA